MTDKLNIATQKKNWIKFYNSWANMMKRCYKKNNIFYHNYGGRGIKVCESWHDIGNFKDDMWKNFLEHNIKHGGQNTSLDKIDNDKDYCKENCRWATAKEQALNRRTTKLFEFNGLSLTLYDWARKLGKNRSTLAMRIHYGWDINKTLTT